MSMETFVVMVFMGVAWWAWAKWQKEQQEGRRRLDEEARIIAEHKRGLTNEEIGKMLGVGRERVRKLVDYWRFHNDEPPMTPAQIIEAQKLKAQKLGRE
jgi:Homeodomain-like domain